MLTYVSIDIIPCFNGISLSGVGGQSILPLCAIPHMTSLQNDGNVQR